MKMIYIDSANMRLYNLITEAAKTCWRYCMLDTLVPEKEIIMRLYGGRLPSESTIWNLRKKGDLPPAIRIGRKRFCDPVRVEEWIQARLGLVEG